MHMRPQINKLVGAMHIINIIGHLIKEITAQSVFKSFVHQKFKV